MMSELREQALMMLLEWAIECGFGYDNFPEEYEKYKDEINDMELGYKQGMIYIAEQEVKEKLNEDEIHIPYYIKEYLLNEVDRYYNAGNTLRCACRMTIRHWLADIDLRFELEEEHKLMDELEKLYDEKER